ncbi:MAG: DUF4491 family protein [Bacteroides sp.]|nr:DUF4491 family protein [Bacteroidales bacterium]MBD5316347.1 DUF4491 family protein [Bacteroides sp.]MBD5377667.1 DUF4491 family protein [Bacteroides sp.]
MTDFLAHYHLLGPVIGICTFLIIGLFHPLVIKGEYYFGTGCWKAFLIVGIITLGASVWVADVLWSSLLGVFSFSSFWSIKEVFEQEERVAKGWFPANPRRASKK